MTASVLHYLKKQADYFQVNRILEEHEEIKAENNRLRLVTGGQSQKIVLQVWKDGKQATLHASTLTKGLAEQAIRAAGLADRKEYFYGLPTPSSASAYRFQRPQDRFFQQPPERLVAMAQEILGTVHDKEVDVSALSLTRLRQQEEVTNNEGVSVQDSIRTVSLSLQASAGKGKSTYWDSVTYPFLFDYTTFAAQVKEKAQAFLHPVQATRSMLKGLTVTFTPEAFSNLMQTAFIENYNGQNVEKGKSLLQGRQGEELFSKVSLMDDGRLPQGILSGKADFEGTPKQQTPLIRNGKVVRFIYDYNTARHNEVPSTGNADVTGINFSDLVFRGPRHEPEDTLLVDTIMGAHTANPLTTAFSVKAEKAFILRNGKITPIAPVMLSGRMLDVLAKIEGVGRQAQYRNHMLTGPVTTTGVHVVP